MTTETHEADLTAADGFRVIPHPNASEYVLEWRIINGTIMTVTSIKLSREGLRNTLAILDGLRERLP